MSNNKQTTRISKSGSNKGHLKRQLNVYQACNDEFFINRLIKDAFFTTKHKGIEMRDDKIVVDLDEFDGDIKDMFDGSGVPYPADEIIGSSAKLQVQLPYKDRSEFQNPQLPDSELLKVLHYYASNRLETQNLNIKESLDDTALLGLGFLAGKWANDMITKQTAAMFIEKYNDELSDNDEYEDEDEDEDRENIDSDNEASDDEASDNEASDNEGRQVPTSDVDSSDHSIPEHFDPNDLSD